MWEFWRSKLARQHRAASPRKMTSGGGVSEPGTPFENAVVNFKDLHLSVDEDDSDDDQLLSSAQCQLEHTDSTNKMDIITRAPKLKKGAERSKLVIILVGLPGRGKTFLCNKLKCYLNWLGHDTVHFNVGAYRRVQKDATELQDASFFDRNNPAGMEARHKALLAAMEDMMRYLGSEKGQVAIFDATNTTADRRQFLASQFHGRFQYLFIESICNDTTVLEQNYRYKMMYSPDYKGVDTEKALRDFKARVLKYEEVYQPLGDRNHHYIKLIDMVTGRGYMDVNRISGYIPGKIVFFLMQICKAGMTQAQSRKIWLTRHGESQYNLKGLIGGDSPLSSRGEEYARLLPDLLIDRLPVTFSDAAIPVACWTSTLKRTIETANYLPCPKLRWKALDEIHAGLCDGMTYEQIAQQMPMDFEARKKDKLRYRYPAGESYLDVIQRLEPVVIEMEREKECICIVGHQAILRALLGYFTATPPEKIPRLEIPLHTLIELRPRPDGTMEVEYIPIAITTPKDAPTTHTPVPSHLPDPNAPVQIPLGSSPVKKSSLSGARTSNGDGASEGGSEPGHARRRTAS